MTPLVLFHTIVSLIGIVSGFVVLAAMLRTRAADAWTKWFLATTIVTSVSAFGLPARMFLPSHAVGLLSLIVLVIACYARYSRRLTGRWRPVYVVAAVVALYFNVFVLVVQLFLKVPFLHEWAPEQSDPPFVMAQGIVLLAFLGAGVLALRRFNPFRT